MIVIIEDMFCIKRFKKELEDGMDFVFFVGSFLMLVVKSYLCEYWINSSFFLINLLFFEVYLVKVFL